MKRVTGKIIYRDAGRETGRETFDLVKHGATRTLRALCEMDAFGLLRDVSLSLDDDMRPSDGFIRLTVDGIVKASTLFLVDRAGVECLGRVDGAAVRQYLPDPAGAGYLGLHPLVCDALVAARRGTHSVGAFMTVPGVTNSHGPNGDEGMLAMHCDIDVAFIGEETVEVAAGRFAAYRYALRWRPEWAPADLWVIKGSAEFLRLQWAMIDADYELVERRCD